MKERIIQSLFSNSGASYAVGAAGFISALVGMFVDLSMELSVKWLILLVWIFSTFLVIFLKLIYDLSNEKKPPAPFEIPIRYIPEDDLLLIRRNENFTNKIVVGCYSNINDIEKLLFLGTVDHVQEGFIQIKILPNALDAKPLIDISTNIKSILVRPVVPLIAIQEQIDYLQKVTNNE